MILLDTNVVSNVMKPGPDLSVLAWLDRQPTSDLHLCSVTLAEIEYGLWILPEGKRRRSLEERFASFVSEGFEYRILDFDAAAARAYAEIMGRRRELGRPMSILDGQIAAIARIHHMAVATQNISDFEECGLELINPFEA